MFLKRKSKEVVESNEENEDEEEYEKAEKGVRLPNGVHRRRAYYESDSDEEIIDEEVDSDLASGDEGDDNENRDNEAGIVLPNGVIRKRSFYDSDDDNEDFVDEEIDSDLASGDEREDNDVDLDGDDVYDDDDVYNQLDEQDAVKNLDKFKKTFKTERLKLIENQMEDSEEEEEEIADGDYEDPFFKLPPENFLQPSDAIIMDTVTAQMAKVFERELRKATKLSIPFIQESDKRSEIDENSRKLTASLLSSSYFKLAPIESGAIVELDAQAYREANPILRNTNKYLEKESELTGIEKRVLAPRFNVPKKRDKVKTNRKDKEREERYEDELAALDKDATAKKKKRDTLDGWFGMEAPELTPDLRQDVMALRLKHATEGRAKNRREVADLKHMPKYFQIGTIVEAPTEFYSARVPKRKRQQSILDEMVSAEKEVGYVTSRYKDLQETLSNVQRRKKSRLFKKSDGQNKRARNK
jgi:hypothetical protein